MKNNTIPTCIFAIHNVFEYYQLRESMNFLHHAYEFKLANLEKKSNKCTFSGYATVFGVVDCYNDIISPEAFEMIDEKCILLWQHNHSEPIGKITSIEKDIRGLYVVGELCLGIQRANDVYHMLKEGIVDSMSIGYTVRDCEYKKHNDDQMVRLIKSIRLWEISLVTFPAYEGAKITDLRSDLSLKQQKYSDDERFFDEERVMQRLDAIIKALKE